MESDLLDYLLACVILFSICFSVVLFFVRRKHYTLEPGPLPFSRAEKAHACFTSPWVWVLLVGGLLFSGVSSSYNETQRRHFLRKCLLFLFGQL